MERPQTLEVPGYQVLHYLGSGARSSIWQIRDPRTGRSYALKRVVKRQSSEQRFLEQAINEYEIGRHFDHPVIRKIHELRRIKRWLSLKEVQLLMEMCEGRTIQEARPKWVPTVMYIFEQVASGLAYMNHQGYVHADIKPNNILVSKKGVVKIIDLGQSCPMGTIKERIQGTPDFIAPEQVQRRPLDTRTDVYNFGASLYWALTGEAVATVLPKKRGLQMPPEPPQDSLERLNSDVPPAMVSLVADCLQRQPKKRPGSVAEVASRISVLRHAMNRKAQQLSGDNGPEDSDGPDDAGGES